MNKSHDIGDYSVSKESYGNAKKIYEENGFVVVKEALGKQMLTDLVDVIGLLLDEKLQALGIKDESSDLDSKLNQLYQTDAKHVDALLRASRETLAFHRLVVSEDIMELIPLVTNLRLPQVVSETCMLRIDMSSSSTRDFEWHYDASYTAQPRNAVVLWVPLLNISSEMGPLKVMPGSHTNDHNVKFHKEYSNKKLAGPKRVELFDIDKKILERDGLDVYPLAPGDVILLHGWTLHRSGINESAHARWIFNPRYSDLLDKGILDNDWRVSRAGEPWVFEEYYPSLVRG